MMIDVSKEVIYIIWFVVSVFGLLLIGYATGYQKGKEE